MKRLVAPLAMLALPLVSACSQQQAFAEAAESQDSGEKAGPAALTHALQVKSSVDGVVIMPLSALPDAPGSSKATLTCEPYVAEPKSAAGKRVAAAGWGVTGEERIGRFQAVSFAGSFEPGTSGTCQIGEGNIGVFDGDRLVALAYAPKSSDRPIGWIVPFESDGLRIWDGDIGSQPLADIRLSDDQLSIVPLAAEERFCDGKSVVSNIYGLPISKARKALWDKGWSQVPNGDAEDRTDPREAALAEKGITEVASCTGTGFGYCGYDYNRTESALAVTTIGDNEDPSVSAYHVYCKTEPVEGKTE